MQVDVLNIKGEVVDTLDLADSVFSIEPNRDAIYRVMLAQQANRRQGTSKTKGRSEVRGGGRKPYRQKGTGRARHGSNRSPIFVGGGVTFGPTPRSFRTRLPKKVRRLAMRSLLSDKVANQKLLVLDSLDMETHKTREMTDILKNVGVTSSALIITSGSNVEVVRSARNIPNVQTAAVNAFSVLDLLKSDLLIVTREALSTIEEVYAS
ncbi:MAG: 50S ribosomal protein L4 [Saccharofermentanales bacterium]|jgi:large subunit ribosomal protein L4|nr:50S ribosomal protein L4 [Eubacteriales bacterium]MDD3611045.1 50S ribosomal protein L4 [Eubacteriales bacterium]HHU03593.1 50S ribosomal protein L4 [Fastidiosipila sp.]